jgi:hypothetical protein
MQNTKGFFGSLFDLSFTSLILTRIIKVLYVLAIIVIGFYALVFILAGFHNSAAAGVLVLLVIAPIFSLAGLIYTRVLLEVFIVLFRIMENTGELVARTTPPVEPQLPGFQAGGFPPAAE